MLEVRGLRVDYGAAPALLDVSLEIRSGELVCIVGPNGAGKTTLVNAIAGLHRAAAGEMTMDGIELMALAPHRFCRAGIAIVPERRRLFTRMTVRENLEIGSYVRAARAARAATLEQVCDLFPAIREKLDTIAGSLSGGQQQMVAIGRALMAAPKLLLLDEPSLGLSPMMVQVMFRAIRDVNATGTAVLLVEQNVAMALDLARRAYLLEEGRIVVLDQGRVLAEGSAADVMARHDVAAAYLGVAHA